MNTAERDSPAVSSTPTREVPETELVGKALDIIEVVALSTSGLLAKDVSAQVGIQLAVGQRLLSALVRRGYIARDPRSKRYSVGTRLLELAVPEPTRARGNGPADP